MNALVLLLGESGVCCHTFYTVLGPGRAELVLRSDRLVLELGRAELVLGSDRVGAGAWQSRVGAGAWQNRVGTGI